MTGPARRRDDGRRRRERYEIVVRGTVGSAVRGALLPVRATTEHETVLRARLAPGVQVADLVSVLCAHGLQVTGVEVVG